MLKTSPETLSGRVRPQLTLVVVTVIITIAFVIVGISHYRQACDPHAPPPIPVPSHSSGQAAFPPPLAKPPRCPSTTPSSSTSPAPSSHLRSPSHPCPHAAYVTPHTSARLPAPPWASCLTLCLQSPPQTRGLSNRCSQHPSISGAPRHTRVSACLHTSALFADAC